MPLAAIGIWLIVTRGSYERVEKIFLFMAFAFFAYPVAAIMAHPDWGDVLHHTVVPTVYLNATYFQLLVGAVGTTITPYMQLFIQSSVAEKGIQMEDYPAERLETYGGSIFAGVGRRVHRHRDRRDGLRRQPWRGSADQRRHPGRDGARAVPGQICPNSLYGGAARRVAAGGGGRATGHGVLGL